MSNLLQNDQVVRSSSGGPCRVVQYLGGGGQGEVYKALWDGREVALKWYYEQSATPEQLDLLQVLIREGSPGRNFLWPEDLATTDGQRGFGYIMRLREQKFKSLTDLVAGKIAPSFMALVVAGLELTKAFRSLHTKGLCYRDISFGNAFFDPQTGDVLVCDNDNVTTNRSGKGGVLGTPDFMAPEIVRREAEPSNLTDLYSLAVLLFYLFHISHPLEGKRILDIRCWDAPARERLFGNEPVFIFDPTNGSNAAVDEPTGEAGRNALIYWSLYPLFFRNTFTKAFTTGLRDPDARITELEWLRSLATLRDALYRCADCRSPNFYDPEVIKATSGRPARCWSCGHELRLPFRMRLGKSVVMLHGEATLYPHHMEDGREFDYSAPVAQVVRHPTEPNVLGLKNLSKEKWVVTLANGVLRDAEPGRSAPLVSGTRIGFGRNEGEIRY